MEKTRENNVMFDAEKLESFVVKVKDGEYSGICVETVKSSMQEYNIVAPVIYNIYASNR